MKPWVNCAVLARIWCAPSSALNPRKTWINGLTDLEKWCHLVWYSRKRCQPPFSIRCFLVVILNA